jgi:hypothetical protein
MKAVIVIIGILIGIGCWQFARVWNYNLSYKSMVEKTVRDMVKDEALRSPAERKSR